MSKVWHLNLTLKKNASYLLVQQFLSDELVKVVLEPRHALPDHGLAPRLLPPLGVGQVVAQDGRHRVLGRQKEEELALDKLEVGDQDKVELLWDDDVERLAVALLLLLGLQTGGLDFQELVISFRW